MTSENDTITGSDTTLTSGDIKVKTQYKMFEKMCATDKPMYLNFDEALKTSREILNL